MDNILDKEELLEEYEDDTEMIEHLLGIFERDIGDRLAKIKTAIGSGDSETLRVEAHTVKGGTGNFFAVAAFETAARLEEMGAEGQCSEAGPVFEQLDKEIGELRAALREIVA